MAPNSQNSIVVGVNNLSDNTPIAWLRISSPGSQYFTIVSASAYQWQADTGSNQTVFTDSSISANGSQNFSIDAQANGALTTNPVSWIVQASSNSGGAGFVTCSGDTSMSISTEPSIINLSDINITEIGPDSVTVLWTTDIPATSQVSYGSDGSYGSSSSLDVDTVFNHSVTLQNLSPNTGYHFQVASTTTDGGSIASGDSTFLTAVQPIVKPIPSPTTSNPASGTATSTNAVNFVITNPKDKTPPTVRLTSSQPKVTTVVPTISGVANDDIAVARVEYSTDGGMNWLPVDTTSGLASQQVVFSFTPIIPDDGSYKIVARAIDTGGNITKTPVLLQIVDRLPPIVGGDVIHAGPQILEQEQDGSFKTEAGIDQHITLSAVGGPTSITLSSVDSNGASKSKQSFSLTKATDSNLWSGILSFAQAGNYSLTATAIDGAGNVTSKVLHVITVLPESKVLQANTTKAVAAEVSVYTLNTDTYDWQLWDAASYGQTNPQHTDSSGNFKLLLPSGTYYVASSARGYHRYTTNRFTLTKPTPLSTIVTMGQDSLKLGPVSLPSGLNLSTKPLQPTSNTPALPTNLKNPRIGHSLPSFQLVNTNGTTVKSVDWLGKPTMLSVSATWLPNTAQQLQNLNQLQTNKDINVAVIGLQQNAGSLQAYNAISGYQLEWLADPDSIFSRIFPINSLPTNYFIDRKGVVKNVIPGVLTKQEMLSNLGNL